MSTQRDTPRVSVTVALLTLALHAAVPGRGFAAEESPAEAAGRDSASAGTDRAEAGRGRILGRVEWGARTPLRVKTLTNTVDVETCGERLRSQSIVTDGRGGIGNAIVELRRRDGRLPPGARRSPGEALVVTLAECATDPHVAIVAPGTAVELVNADNLEHELSTRTSANAPWLGRVERYRRRVRIPARHLGAADAVRLACERHAATSAWWYVTENARAVLSEPDGSFRMDDVPAGAWRLLVWHEELGTLERDVTVTAGQATEIAIELR